MCSVQRVQLGHSDSVTQQVLVGAHEVNCRDWGEMSEAQATCCLGDEAF